MKREKGRQDRLPFLILLGLLLFCPGCGKKGPPVAPEAVVPPPVNDFKADVVSGEVRLTWSVPKKGDTMFGGIEGFRVYKYQTGGFVAPCPGCPIPFSPWLDIRLKDPEPAQVEGDRITCYDRVESGYRYVYKVIVYHKTGGVSEDSNLVFCYISGRR